MFPKEASSLSESPATLVDSGRHVGDRVLVEAEGLGHCEGEAALEGIF